MKIYKMENIWKTLKFEINRLSNHNLNLWNEGASRSDIELIETTIGCKLPQDYIDFLNIHNGQNGDEMGTIYTDELLASERIMAEWHTWKKLLDDNHFEETDGTPTTSEPSTGIKNNWWNPLWIPITYDGSGNHYCLDLDPTPEGTFGQVIRMWHDDVERNLIAPSFSNFITNYCHQLTSNSLVFSEDYGGFVAVEDL